MMSLKIGFGFCWFFGFYSVSIRRLDQRVFGEKFSHLLSFYQVYTSKPPKLTSLAFCEAAVRFSVKTRKLNASDRNFMASTHRLYCRGGYVLVHWILGIIRWCSSSKFSRFKCHVLCTRKMIQVRNNDLRWRRRDSKLKEGLIENNLSCFWSKRLVILM
jgi:hypothetical protein